MNADLAIVIPAFNEAATIGGVVGALAATGRVIVVDDGSNDGTAQVAARAGAEVVRHAANRGYDGALDSGFARAAELDCHYVVTLDADGQHPAEMVETFAAALRDGADLVLGVRDRLQRLAERIFALATRFGYGIRDPLCGMKGYRIELYRGLGHFDRYGSIGTELMLHAVRSGAKMVQIPLHTRERADAPRFGRLLKANWRILRAAWLGLVARRPAQP